MNSLVWMLLAFLGGGTVGVFLMALMRLAAEEPLRSAVPLAPRADRQAPHQR